MPRFIGFSEAKARLSEITEEVHRTGETIVILKHNHPWVSIAPVTESFSGRDRHLGYGSLHKYSDPKKIELEDQAWDNAIKERYANR